LFDVPLAAHVLRALFAAGVTDVVVNLHHLPELLKQALKPCIPAGLRVRWSPEATILGTGGALLPWREFFAGEAFFLVNADTYQELDWGAMARQHRRQGGVATLALRQACPGADAPIEMDPSGRIIRFLGSRYPGAGRGIPCEFTGVHLLEPEVLAQVPAAPCCINADVHAKLVGRGALLFGYLAGGNSFWSDLGTIGRYLEAHRRLLEQGKVPLGATGRAVFRDTTTKDGGHVLAPSYVGRGARVEEEAVAGPFAVLGHGSRVGQGARVTGSVLWSRARVEGKGVRGAVVSSSGRMVAMETPSSVPSGTASEVKS
jgi:NDP-sugar pyrophosphorylase family protein